MRRRLIILLGLAACVLAGPGVAGADPPITTAAVKALGESPDAQVGPAVAVDPAGGTTIHTAATATDWRSGVLSPQTGLASGTISSTTGATTWTDRGFPPNYTGGSHNAISGGSADIVWGPGNKVYAVEVGRDENDQTDPCAPGAGLYLLVSANSGATWNTIMLVANSPNQVLTDPSIAYSAATGRIYVAYTNTIPTPSCTTGTSPTSVIRLLTVANDDGTGGIQITQVAALSATPLLSPSVAALPGGRVAIAYYDASTSPGRVLESTCVPSVPGNPLSDPACGAPPVVVDPAALDPGTLGSLPVHVRPSIATGADGRMVVAWAEQTPLNGMDVFSATSRDGGASFGAPVRVPADFGSADQIDPSVAIASDGRADIAFLDSRFGTGYQVAVSSSNLPTGTLNGETWSPSVPVESTPILPSAPFIPGPISLGGRVGIDEVPRMTGRAWTLVSWTDTRNVGTPTPRNEDIYSTVLLHQSVAPAGVDSAYTVGKNRTSAVSFAASESDADADPETYSIATQGTLGQATIPDPNVPVLSYSAPNSVTTDHVQVRIDDGVQQSTMNVTLNIVNTPPRITCTSLTTVRDIQLALTTAACVTDDNGDPVTLSANSAVNGSLTTIGGVLYFQPTEGFTGTARVTLVASDGSDTTSQSVNIVVTPPAAVAVSLAGASPRAARTDRPLALHAIVPPDVDPSQIVWSFGDRTPDDHGAYVTHLFTVAGQYSVTAQFGDDGPPTKLEVFVSPPPLVVRSTLVQPGGSIRLRVKLAAPGTLKLAMMHVSGARTLKQKMKRGSHTIELSLPAGARGRGTVVVKLSLGLGNGGTETIKRAIMLPRG
jgi:hypothetical protein